MQEVLKTAQEVASLDNFRKGKRNLVLGVIGAVREAVYSVLEVVGVPVELLDACRLSESCLAGG